MNIILIIWILLLIIWILLLIIILICINYINDNKYNKNDNMTKELVWSSG